MPSIELVIAAFLGIMLLASIVSIRAKVPYTLVLVFIGIALTAASASFYLGSGPIQDTIQGIITAIRSLSDQLIQTQGGSSLFVGLIVPPLIFEAMMHIRSNDLRAVIRPSVSLATIGVVISTLVCGLVLWKIAGLSVYVSFLFAALISPTDVATVLEIFRRAKVPSRLATLMDTEATFNDATAIVVFTIVLTSINVARPSLTQAVSNFIIVFAGGIVVGLVIAFAGEVLTSLMQDKLAETILTISAVYGSYALATSLRVSGLVAVTIVGLYFGNLTIRTAMGPGTRESVTVFWQFAAFVGNSIAFLFIGFRTDILKLAESASLIVISYLAVTAARVASVYPILTLSRIEKKTKIPLRWMNVATLGGTRGALSIALAASISASAFVSLNDITVINTMVLGVAFISISLQAGLLFRYVRKRFPEEQRAEAEALGVRLSRAVAAIETLQKLKEEGKIPEREFASQLEADKDELRDVIGDIGSSVGTRTILKSRANDLYSSIVTLPMSKAMHILKLNRLSKPIESMIDKTAEENGDKTEEKKDDEKG
ncbi:MAG: cation:proton antiporter [Nitrososphaerales archaeon]